MKAAILQLTRPLTSIKYGSQSFCYTVDLRKGYMTILDCVPLVKINRYIIQVCHKCRRGKNFFTKILIHDKAVVKCKKKKWIQPLYWGILKSWLVIGKLRMKLRGCLEMPRFVRSVNEWDLLQSRIDTMQ